MSEFSLLGKCVAAGALSLAVATGHGGQAPDTLEQQAVASRLAATSMLAGISRAGDRLVAVGVKGHILTSEDEGESWHQTTDVPVTVTLTDVCFNDDQHGWAVGHRGAILRTQDGGVSWSLQYDGFQAAKDLHQALETAGSENAFYGEMMVEDGADKPFLGIDCLGDQSAVVVGAYGFGFSTKDGGDTWLPSPELFDGTQQMHVYGLSRLGDRLMFGGERGLLFSMTKSLDDFEPVAAPYDGTFFGVLGLGNGQLVAYGLRGNAYWSTDAGNSWSPSSIAGNQNLTAGMLLANGNVLLLDNAGRGWLSRDAGKNFIQVLADRSFPMTDLVQLANGDVIASGAGGVARFSSVQLN